MIKDYRPGILRLLGTDSWLGRARSPPMGIYSHHDHVASCYKNKPTSTLFSWIVRYCESVCVIIFFFFQKKIKFVIKKKKDIGYNVPRLGIQWRKWWVWLIIFFLWSFPPSTKSDIRNVLTFHQYELCLGSVETIMLVYLYLFCLAISQYRGKLLTIFNLTAGYHQ